MKTKTSSSKTNSTVFVKRFKVACPVCGQKIWNDAREYHFKVTRH